jgi:hypothetical protein
MRDFLGCPLLLAISLPAMVGCGDSASPPTPPVIGQVFLDGRLLESGTVVFHADASRGNTTLHEPRGQIVRGRYRLITAGMSGAPPGAYKVTVLVRAEANGKSPYSLPVWRVSPIYLDPERTPLRVVVVVNPMPGAYDLKLLP